jgi:tetratricopeptide (TPR) repeat protein
MTAPLVAGTVFYAYGLSDVLSAFFLLLALLILTWSPSSVWIRRVLLSLLAGLCLLLALAAKQSAVILPALVISADAFTRRADWKRRIGEVYAPLLILGVTYIFVRWRYFGAIGDLEGRGSTIEAADYALFQGAMILKYLAMTIWPRGFTIDHFYTAGSVNRTWQTLAWLAIALITLFAARAATKRNAAPLARWFGLGWTFFLLALLPTSSFLPTVDMFVERRAYLADLGVFLFLGGWAAAAVNARSRTRAVSAGLVIATALTAQIVITLQRGEVYASTEALWREALVHDTGNFRARTNLAVYYSAAKKYEEARRELEVLATATNDNGGIYSKLAYLYMQPDYERYDEHKAWEYMQRSLALKPDNIFALYNGGMLQLKRGEYQEAEKLFIHATELNPLMTAAWVRAGEAAQFQNKRLEAIAYFRRALELDDGQEDAKAHLRELGVF